MTTLTNEQKDVIVGSLLGDGNLSTGTDGRTWRYRALQQKRDLPYLEYKYQVLKEFCAFKSTAFEPGIICNQTYDERTKRTYERCYFNTKVNDCFKHYGNIFYTKDVKTNNFVKDVPKNIQQMLTPRALAIMYQDDGALKWLGHSNAMRICTESFSDEGNERLVEAIKNNFNVFVKLEARRNRGVLIGQRISIPERSSKAFVEIIKPYLIDCMKYKVSDGNYGHL